MNTANLESQLYTIDMFLATGKRPTDGQIDQMIWALPEDKRSFFIKRVNEKLLEAGFEIRYAVCFSSIAKGGKFCLTCNHQPTGVPLVKLSSKTYRRADDDRAKVHHVSKAYETMVQPI